VNKALIFLLPLLGCAISNEPDTLNTDWKSMSVAQRDNALDRIADECALPRSAIKPRNGDEFGFESDNKSGSESFDGAIKKLTMLNISKIGFIGNEASVEENK
jgi:hypothetical protein